VLEVPEELIVRIRESWVPLADFQAAMGRIFGRLIELTPEEAQPEGSELAFRFLDNVVLKARPSRPGDVVLRGSEGEALIVSFLAEAATGAREELEHRTAE
jgi:hypothetical protein